MPQLVPRHLVQLVYRVPVARGCTHRKHLLKYVDRQLGPAKTVRTVEIYFLTTAVKPAPARRNSIQSFHSRLLRSKREKSNVQPANVDAAFLEEGIIS